MKEFKRLLRWLRAPTEYEKKLEDTIEYIRQDIKRNTDATNNAIRTAEDLTMNVNREIRAVNYHPDTVIQNLHTIQTRLNNIEHKINCIGEMMIGAPKSKKKNVKKEY